MRKSILICQYANASKKASHVTYQAMETEEPATIEDTLDGSQSEEWKLVADTEQ